MNASRSSHNQRTVLVRAQINHFTAPEVLTYFGNVTGELPDVLENSALLIGREQGPEVNQFIEACVRIFVHIFCTAMRHG